MESLEEVEAIFGEAIVDSVEIPKRRRFVFHVHAVDHSHLAFHVTDFLSNTWESLRSLPQLDDMRDEIGIGGTWSEFMDYVMSSFKSQHVNLLLHGDFTSPTGSGYAKLVAQKTKGMPRISISLKRLTDSAASEAIANLSLELFQAYKSTRDLSVQEQERSFQLKNVISAEWDKSESIKSQLEQYPKRPKLQNVNFSDTAGSSALSNNNVQSPDKQVARGTRPVKVANCVVPAHRRARVRGILLEDTEDNEDTKQ